ncbi:unnamed protein product [Phyllotreta striolata]|uniref:Zinc finger HIT domain-containing protein 3 n=1 Tax=Phyllotreta striolata TaxID=444603 RepID=A0A9N9TK25_PHYSR|nr:unnamed protein product [Phyllotreta striolata]
MNKICDICQKEARYKCPTCLIYYCSVTCCKKHRQNKCDVIQRDEQTEAENLIVKKRKLEPLITESTVPDDKLKLLSTSEEINSLLSNSHLRNLLTTIDKDENADEMMQKAMQEPLFVEFSDACLKVVEPQPETTSNTSNTT